MTLLEVCGWLWKMSLLAFIVACEEVRGETHVRFRSFEHRSLVAFLDALPEVHCARRVDIPRAARASLDLESSAIS